MNIELSKNGERKKENGFVDLSEPKIISLIINTHENELGYSLDEMLKLLGINEKDYFEYFNRSTHQISVKPRRVIDFASYSRKN